VSPSRRHTFRASTPRSRSSLRASAATRQLTFRPRGFAPPQRFSPRESHGSVAPRNRPRVRRVSCLPPPRHPEVGERRDNPRDAVHTLRRLPLISSRTDITVAVAFLPLPSCPTRPPACAEDLPTAAPPEWRAYTALCLLAGPDRRSPEGHGVLVPGAWGPIDDRPMLRGATGSPRGVTPHRCAPRAGSEERRAGSLNARSPGQSRDRRAGTPKRTSGPITVEAARDAPRGAACHPPARRAAEAPKSSGEA